LTLDECGKSYLNNEQRLIVYRCLADSSWFLHEYQLAESYLKKLLHSYKQLGKIETNSVDIRNLKKRKQQKFFIQKKKLFRLNQIG